VSWLADQQAMNPTSLWAACVGFQKPTRILAAVVKKDLSNLGFKVVLKPLRRSSKIQLNVKCSNTQRSPAPSVVPFSGCISVFFKDLQGFA
jgi:hypothetical protein